MSLSNVRRNGGVFVVELRANEQCGSTTVSDILKKNQHPEQDPFCAINGMVGCHSRIKRDRVLLIG